METFKTIRLRNNETVTMKLTQDWDGEIEITFWQGTTELSGEFEFIMDEENEDRFLLARMYAPFKHNGLGEQALIFFKEETDDAVIWTREPFGPKYDDGSYLTEDAPAFVMKMQRLGLIQEWDYYGEEPEDWEL